MTENAQPLLSEGQARMSEPAAVNGWASGASGSECDRFLNRPGESTCGSTIRTLPDLNHPVPPFHVVALAASAGGVEALSKVLSGIPADFPAAVLVVQHRTAQEPFQLPHVLSHHTMLMVEQARQGATLCQATVFLAPPDRHLLVNANGTLSLSQSAKVHHVRPSADRLFESVAISFKKRAIAVVLTGVACDGNKGVQIIKKRGGVVIAQEPTTADFPGMPRSAIETGAVDLVVPLDQIASTLISLVTRGEPSVTSSLLSHARTP